MSINKSYAIFGLGRYGMAVAKELVLNGIDLIAVDSDQQIINNAAAELPVCKCADITDPEVLRQLGIENIDVVIIAMASNLEGSVLAITLCKELGVKHIIVKCANDMHKKIYMQVGADEVVFPEKESGTRLAKNLLSSGIIDMIALSDDVSLLEFDVKPEWVNKSLMELNLRKKYSINVVGHVKNGNVSIDVDPTELLQSEDKLIIIAPKNKLSKLI